jgi:hypothetical protein
MLETLIQASVMARTGKMTNQKSTPEPRLKRISGK